MARQRPPVNRNVLRWAFDESGLSPNDVASRIEVAPEIVSGWLAGGDGPSRGEFNRLVALLRRPASVFFLPTAPASSGLPPSLRRAVGRDERQLTFDELRQVRRARRIQRLVNLLVQDEGSAPIQVPGINAHANSDSAGAILREWLGITIDQQRSWESLREAFNTWRDALESRGVLVMQLRLGNGGLRGFSFADPYAPLVAVNTAENLQARIFTLLHEAAHLVSGTGTACLEGVAPSPSDGSVERWCDRVASAAAAPLESLREAVSIHATAGQVTLETVQQIADFFSLSLRATAVALIRAGLAPADLYTQIEEQFPSSDYKKGFGRGRAQRAPQLRLSEVGPLAASRVIEAMSSNKLSEREARQYLRLDGAELSELAAELGGSE